MAVAALAAAFKKFRRFDVIEPPPETDASASHSLIGIDNPGNAEPVDQHAEPFRPESRLKRHLHVALVLREGVEHPLPFGSIVEVKRDAEPGRPGELT